MATNPSIVLYLGYANLLSVGGVYGSELALVRLARQFMKRGYSVDILSKFPITPNDLGLNIITPAEYLTKMYDVLIISRYINFYLYLPVRAKKTFIWLHDVGLQPFFNGVCIPENGKYLLDNVVYDGIIAQTKWHSKVFKEWYTTAENLTVIGNGIDTTNFQLKGVMPNSLPKVPYSFIWTSSPKRGLSYLLSIFPVIHSRWPEAKLYIFRGPEEFTTEQLAKVEELKEYVFYCGALPNEKLINEFLQAEVWFYPTNFCETYCISALEAQAAGCLCVCSDLAALSEVVEDRGVLLKSPHGSAEYLDECIEGLDKVFADKETYSRKAREWGLQQDWSDRCDSWEALAGLERPEESLEVVKTQVGIEVITYTPQEFQTL